MRSIVNMHNCTGLVLLFLAICQCLQVQALISCKGPDGHDVEWFYAYKLPAHYPPPNGDQRRRGLEFVYLLPNSTGSWLHSELSIEDAHSLIGRTVEQSSDGDLLVVAYNDEPPGHHTDGQRGHTKGLLVADAVSAFWLIHSVPLFPVIDPGNSSAYTYPTTGKSYAQSFLCISTNATQLDTIATQLLYNEPHFYQLRIPPKLAAAHPSLTKLANNATITQPPYNRFATIQTRSGLNTFHVFAKTRRYGHDLYEDWLSVALDTDLFVETWRHGTGLLPSNCSRTRRVWNIAGIRMRAVQYDFRTSADHSKWAVASGSKASWICVGDVNRAERQMSRGGGTVCQPNVDVAERYRELIQEVDQCPKKVTTSGWEETNEI